MTEPSMSPEQTRALRFLRALDTSRVDMVAHAAEVAGLMTEREVESREPTKESLDALIEGTLNDLGAKYGYHLEQRVIRQVALREFRDAILASQPTSESRSPRLTREQVVNALQLAWNDFVSDTGSIPDCFTIHGPRTTQVVASFAVGNFATFVRDVLDGVPDQARAEGRADALAEVVEVLEDSRAEVEDGFNALAEEQYLSPATAALMELDDAIATVRQVALREFRDAILASQPEQVECPEGCITERYEIGDDQWPHLFSCKFCPRCGQSLKGAGE